MKYEAKRKMRRYEQVLRFFEDVSKQSFICVVFRPLCKWSTGGGLACVDAVIGVGQRDDRGSLGRQSSRDQ